MSKKNQTSPDGIAIFVDAEGVVEEIIHDSYTLFSLNEAFTNNIEGDSISKAHQFIERIHTHGVEYEWEFHITNEDTIDLFCFSGVKLDGKLLLVGTINPDDTEQFLNGLMEMNNESVNKLRSFMKARQKSENAQQEEWQIYEEMSGLNNELANMQRKLMKKTAELERINELKDQMLGMAAHDLRNPLTLIQNYALFLIEDHREDDIFTSDQFELIKEVKESSEYMVQIIEDMLDISAIESGSINLDKTEEDIGKLIERTVSLNQNSAGKKQISLTADLPSQPVVKEIDAHKFQQVLDNLISNAIKYSEFETNVKIGLKRNDGDGRIIIYVEDQGQGIPEDELDDLFVPFSKISVVATAGEKSTGLGLAIAKKIVEAHGGEVNVESKVGEGSTFSVSIP